MTLALWLILGAMTLVVVVVLLRPLLAASKPMASRAAYDLQVYRDQLAEVKRDEARGVLAASEAEAATREIKRRVLAAVGDDEALAAAAGIGEASAAPGRASRRWVAYGIAAALPLAAIVLYLAVGFPEAPDAPFAGRQSEANAANGQMPDIKVALPHLEAELKANPSDLQGWLLLARSYQALGRNADAVGAFRHAADLAPGNAEILAAFGETMVMSENGAVNPEAKQIFQRAVALDPRSLPARFYLGLAQAQAGDGRDAVRAWLAIEAEAPKDAPWLPALRDQIKQTASQFGLDVATLAPAPEPPAAPSAAPGGSSGAPSGMGSGMGSGVASGGAPEVGSAAPSPSSADIAAAANMTDAQRQEMIQGMVDRLAARLEQNPNDVEGWRRLSRAYIVLHQRDKAIAALDHVVKLAPDDTVAAKALAALKASN